MHLILRILLFIGLLFFPLIQKGQTHQPSRFIWSNQHESDRFQVTAFRYDLETTEMVSEAMIHLFADSRYHLIVNGQFVNFGPARFYPAHPMYDSYNIGPYLKKGKNAISVKVFSNGTSSFQLRRNPGGFIAWGNVKTIDNQSFSLETPGNWRCMPLNGYHGNTPRMSFATGPMEVYDSRKDDQDWYLPEHSFNGESPVEVEKQEIWGELTPRNIPHLTREVYKPQELVGAYRLKNEEEMLSFRVAVPDKSQREFRHNRPLLGYTYIYSPTEQELDAGIWWGNHYLNGEGPLQQENAGPDKPHRQTIHLSLKKGWNAFFVQRNSFWGKWDFFMAYPKTAGLILSPNKKKNDENWFRVAGPFLEDEEKTVNSLKFPLSPKDLPANLSSGWKDIPVGSFAHNPAVEMSWQYLGEKMELPSIQVENITLDQPSALVFDFRYKKLARIVVEYEAPEGTILDVGFSEDLIDERARVTKRNGVYPAVRHIAREGKNRFETLKPYGIRYLQVNVSHFSGSVKIKKVYVINQVYPFEQIGDFACSDPLMNQIWDLGWRTLRVCAEDSYTDTPFRERGLYAGDMLPQMALTLAGSGDLRLVKRCLELFQDMYIDQFFEDADKHPDEIGLLEDYPLLTLEALKWYLDRTGDLDFAESLYPQYAYLLQKQIDKRNAEGMIFNQRVFIEWTQLQKSNVYSSAYHALLTRSCKVLASIAEDLGKEDDRMAFTNYAEDLTRSFQQLYWDEKKGAFRDGYYEDKPIDHHYPISSAWPMLFGMTTPEQDAQIMQLMPTQLADIGEVDRKRLSTPYGGFYLLLALAQVEKPEVAEAFIRKYWSPMIFRHDDTAWENFGDNGIGTLSHAWSGGPTYYLTSQVLGVDLGWPGPSDPEKVVISPLAETIDWAKGKVPHPKGVIEVSWEVNGGTLFVDYKGPEGVEYDVRPKGRLAELDLWVNGEQVKE